MNTRTPEHVETPPASMSKGERRREQILDAATRLFTEAGFRGVSLRDIATAAEISHPGLLRYFSDTDDILFAVVERFERRNGDWWEERLRAGLSTGPADLARRNASIPGYIPLFTTLAGEATSADHPSHERMRERYRTIAAREADGIPDDPLEKSRFTAAWDGLQLLSLYRPDEIDVPERLERHLARRDGLPLPARTDLPPNDAGWSRSGLDSRSVLTAPARGYAPGRTRRDRIIADATTLFARNGFHGTSLQDLAEAVGIAKSTLVHHIGSKDELLLGVVRHRDELLAPTVDTSTWSAVERADALVEGAARNSREQPGLVSVYAVLSCEAAAADHPAHDYFADRFDRGRAFMADLVVDLVDEGLVHPDRDPREEGDWFIALWDGLQYQWLYDPDTVDVAAQLRAHLDALAAEARGGPVTRRTLAEPGSRTD